MPDPQRPSVAPLSESEADRLSERFTASWDDPAPAPLSGVVPPPAADAAVPVKAKPKPTLLGIAPVVVGPAPPPPAPPAPLPAPAPKAAVLEAPVSVPPPSSPDSSVARGLTTPSKPYIPKDDPSTPAVVISEDVRKPASQPSPDRARIAQTIPGQTRSNPVAAPLPLAPPAAAIAEVDDTYPPMRRPRSKLPFLLAGAAVLGVAAFAVAKLGGNTAPKSLATTTSAPPVVAATTAPAVTAAEPAPQPPVAAVPEPVPVRSPEPVAAEPAAPPPKATKNNAKKTTASLAAPRKTSKTDTKVDSKPSAAEPGTSKPKGVIVRETPF